MTGTELDRLIAELEELAARLRAGTADADEAAVLVERCAELAGELGGELDRRERAAGTEPLWGSQVPGQQELG